MSWHQNAVYATVQPLPVPPLPESMGVEGSGSGDGSEKMAGMEKKEVKESIEVREWRCISCYFWVV
jgi:hypothetical protein